MLSSIIFPSTNRAGIFIFWNVESAARVQIDQADQRQILPEERFRAAKNYISLFLVGTWHLLRGSSKQVLGPVLDGTWFGYKSSGPGFRDEAFELVPGQKLVAPTRSSKQVFDETWFGDLSSGPGFGDKATFEQVLLKFCHLLEVLKASLGISS